jgi:hypothetical protein
VNQWLNPLKRGTGSNLVDVGRAAVRAEPTEGEATPIPGHVDRVGGHIEGLRRRCGEAAGEELVADPANRCTVNVGTVAWLPFLSPSLDGNGQVCRRLMAEGRGGASVKVRGRESRSHGEGRQQVRSRECGMPGARR